MNSHKTVSLQTYLFCQFCQILTLISTRLLQVSPTEINLRRVLVGHRAAVNVVDFDEKYIVSASGDRTIKVWNTR